MDNKKKINFKQAYVVYRTDEQLFILCSATAPPFLLQWNLIL